MNHDKRIDDLIAEHGSFEAIPWGTMFGKKTTIGEMTDNHVMNSVNHHYGMRYVLLGQLGYVNRPEYDGSDTVRRMNEHGLNAELESCAFNEYLMREIQRRRGTDTNAEDH